jgi:hypothetical protein
MNLLCLGCLRNRKQCQPELPSDSISFAVLARLHQQCAAIDLALLALG